MNSNFLNKLINLAPSVDLIGYIKKTADEAKQHHLAEEERRITFSSSAGKISRSMIHQEQFKDAIFRGEDIVDKNTISTVYFITNNTSDRLELINTNTKVSISPPSIRFLDPYEATYFCERTVCKFKELGPTHPNNRVHAQRFFIYSNATTDKIFVIETNFRLKTSSSYYSSDVPTRNHRVTSIGSTHLHCTSTLKNTLNEAPYSYLVDIQIGEAFIA
ncbi:hypothetical protein BK659_24560 [Pseudomonas brassicacearum]|uniref:Uncharacterized protein n=1 Tax=Pseudomonas brassicacearum TaxID=930166 RepID=A0A423GVR7_9PSED|nr:hypothetical protein [Pseudomonas brassicacearum]RON01686.1 hypothetical protein BK659_24560 [Pseudomonas brassicacearum]